MKEQQLKSYALAAEIIGSAAVVITLVFLVLETSENTRAIQAQSYMTLTSELNRLRENMHEPNVAVVFAEFSIDRNLPESPADRYIFGQTLSAMFSLYEVAYYAHKKGVLDASEWGRFDRLACYNLDVFALMWSEDPQRPIYKDGLRFGLTSEFVEYLETSCDWASIREGPPPGKASVGKAD